MSEPLVICITLNWNTKEDTKECIQSLLRSKYSNFSSIIVDNGSNDGSIKYLNDEFGSTIKIINNKRNLGYSLGFNKGINHAIKYQPDFILIHNSDIIFKNDTISQLVKIAITDKKIGFVTGKVYYYDRPKILQTVGKENHPINLKGKDIGTNEIDVGQYDKIREYDYVDDVFLLINSKVIQNVGIFDKEFFLMYEITDWCFRVRKKEYKIVYTPYAKVWHKGSLSFGEKNSALSKYYLSRNQILFMRKNATKEIYKKFIIQTFTYRLLKEVIAYCISSRFDLIKAIIKGKISGIIWIITSNRKNSP